MGRGGLKDFIVYPNPASDLVEIELKKEQGETIDIINQNGQFMVRSSSTHIDLTDFSTGLYFVRVGSFAEKLLLR